MNSRYVKLRWKESHVVQCVESVGECQLTRRIKTDVTGWRLYRFGWIVYFVIHWGFLKENHENNKLLLDIIGIPALRFDISMRKRCTWAFESSPCVSTAESQAALRKLSHSIFSDSFFCHHFNVSYSSSMWSLSYSNTPLYEPTWCHHSVTMGTGVVDDAELHL